MVTQIKNFYNQGNSDLISVFLPAYILVDLWDVWPEYHNYYVCDIS
jgi:hypothetical protein